MSSKIQNLLVIIILVQQGGCRVSHLIPLILYTIDFDFYGTEWQNMFVI